MIDGLKLTMTGEQLRARLERRSAWHRARAAWWTGDTRQAKEDETGEALDLPECMSAHEAARHAWRADVLTFIHDHVDAGENYRLTADDLEYGELLPPAPGSVEQDDYEERSRIGFNLERLVKSVDQLVYSIPGVWERPVGTNPADRPWRETVVEETDEHRTTRVDVEGGPEILKIERK